MSDEMIELDFDRIVTKTELAWYLDFGGAVEWIPMSLGEVDERAKTVDMPEWLAVKKGLV